MGSEHEQLDELQRFDIRKGEDQEKLDLQMGSELRWIDLRMGAEQDQLDELQHIDFPIGVDRRQVQLHIPESKRFRRLQPSICRRVLTLIFNLAISIGVIISLV